MPDPDRIIASSLQQMVFLFSQIPVKKGSIRSDTIDLPAELNGTFDPATAIFGVHEVPDPKRLFSALPCS